MIEKLRSHDNVQSHLFPTRFCLRLAVIKVITALCSLVLTFASASAQDATTTAPDQSIGTMDLNSLDLNLLVSSYLGVAISWVAEQDMDFTISSALSQATSWAAENDFNAIASSVGSEAGITDASGMSSAFAEATELWDSLTGAFATDLGALPSIVGEAFMVHSTGSQISSTITDEATSTLTGTIEPANTTDATQDAVSTYVEGSAADWSAPVGAALGSFLLGLVAYL